MGMELMFCPSVQLEKEERKAHGGGHTPIHSGDEDRDAAITLDRELIPYFTSHPCVCDFT